MFNYIYLPGYYVCCVYTATWEVMSEWFICLLVLMSSIDSLLTYINKCTCIELLTYSLVKEGLICKSFTN